MAAEPTLEEIERHGEDCHSGLCQAKRDLERARAEYARAAEAKGQTEARLRNATAPIENPDTAAALFGKGKDPEATWREAEAAHKADWLAGAELAAKRKVLEQAEARVKALREEAVDYIGQAARKLAEAEMAAEVRSLALAAEARGRLHRVRDVLDRAVSDANKRARASLPPVEGASDEANRAA
jgi:exonuclease VII small subunit